MAADARAGRSDADGARVGFRPPLSSALPVAGVLVLFGLVFPFGGTWVFVIGFTFVYAVLRLRQLMVLTEEQIEVTVVRTRRIPWSSIEEFRPGATVQGGTVIRTADGQVHSVSPCSWWGGPADAADIETLNRILARHRRAR